MKRMLKVKHGCNVFDEVSVYVRRKGYLYISKTTIMKKNLFLAIALACIVTSPAYVSCSKELAIEPEEQAPKEELPTAEMEEIVAKMKKSFLNQQKPLTEEEMMNQTPMFGTLPYDGENAFITKRNEILAQYTTRTVDGWRITKDAFGLVTRVDFLDNTYSLPPVDGKAFLVKFFGKEAAAEFVRVRDERTKSGKSELYAEYCGDMTVSHYVFNYDSQGVMYSAAGAYYPTDCLNPNPTISSDCARKIFASYLGKSLDKIGGTRLSFELIPNETHFVPTLVYKVILNNEGSSFYTCYAWVDAHSGRLITLEEIS